MEAQTFQEYSIILQADCHFLLITMSKPTPHIIQLPKIVDTRGNLSFLEGKNHIPFKIKRAYWIYDVPGGETRGGHAFKEQEEFIIALSGSFDVVINSGKRQRRYHLNRSYFGLYVPKGRWRFMDNFSTNSIALVLASTHFNERDYIRNFDKFTEYVQNKQTAPEQIKACNENLYKPSTDDFHKGTVEQCEVIALDINHRDRGNITVIENQDIISFDIERVYYLYDVPGGEERGGHAHRELSQLIIAAGGSFDVLLDDGVHQKRVSLNRPYQALKVVPGIWREIDNFSSGSSCLVLASHPYDESDYIRDYTVFTNEKLK